MFSLLVCGKEIRFVGVIVQLESILKDSAKLKKKLDGFRFSKKFRYIFVTTFDSNI